MDGVSDDADESYEQYLAQHRSESDREFAEGGHDYTDPDEFYADGDDPKSYEDYVTDWQDAQEEAAMYRRLEARYPDARI